MPRKYKPTGKPNGRPTKEALRARRQDSLKVKAMNQAERLMKQLDVPLTESELEVLERSKGNIQPAPGEKWGDTSVPAHAMVPLKELVPLTESQLKEASARARGILGAVVAGFHDKVPGLLDRLAERDEEKALKLYIELMEYQAPKLARVENTGQVDHRHQVFVSVEPRDEDPRRIEARVLGGPDEQNDTPVVAERHKDPQG